MPYFEDFSGFESIKIALNKSVSVEQVRDFFKSFPYKTIIDTDDMDLTDVYRFCTLDYAAMPMIKNIYNTEVVSVNEMKESLEVVFDFAKKLEKATLDTIEEGYMTGDLAALAEPKAKQILNSWEFIAAIKERL